MSSAQLGELLSAYLDGELRDGELEIVVSHLNDCLECIAEFHDLKEARAAVRMMPMLQVPDRSCRPPTTGLSCQLSSMAS